MSGYSVARLLRDTASGRGGALFVVGESGAGTDHPAPQDHAVAGRAVACAGVLGDLVQEEFEAERSVAAAALLPDEFDQPHPGVGVGSAYRGGQDVHQDVGHIGDHIGTAHRDHPLCLPGASPAAPADHLRG
ncbi:hypothetical protein [Streptomyces mirabilis]|uniref:hypothetical protein n=1 Tax=Streptomyces mirabilis TaxID=68239 RepID=UPI0032470A70